MVLCIARKLSLASTSRRDLEEHGEYLHENKSVTLFMRLCIMYRYNTRYERLQHAPGARFQSACPKRYNIHKRNGLNSVQIIRNTCPAGRPVRWRDACTMATKRPSMRSWAGCWYALTINHASEDMYINSFYCVCTNFRKYYLHAGEVPSPMRNAQSQLLIWFWCTIDVWRACMVQAKVIYYHLNFSLHSPPWKHPSSSIARRSRDDSHSPFHFIEWSRWTRICRQLLR